MTIMEAHTAEFNEKYPKTLEMLNEIKDRIPWQRGLVASLQGHIKRKGNLTPKQASLVTSLYLDNCVKSDGEIKQQVECRKLCLRLMECRLGKTQDFVRSVASYTYDRPFSLAQMRCINKVATRKRKELSSIPEFDEHNFDGWHQVFIRQDITP